MMHLKMLSQYSQNLKTKSVQSDTQEKKDVFT